MVELEAKRNRLFSIAQRCRDYMNSKATGETIVVRVPRYALDEAEGDCVFLGVKGKFVNKTTCCVEIEFPVKQLYQAIKDSNLIQL